MRRVIVTLLATLALAASSGCLVISLQPAYEDDWLAWDPNLLGTWRDADDNVSIAIDAAEWRSYRVHYEHPSEKGDVSGFLTIIGDDRYLDLMPARGADRGSFVLPVHVILRAELTGDQLVLTPLSYDWFADRLRAHRTPPVPTVFDQKQNTLIVAPTAQLRSWFRAQPKESAIWGAAATFTRVK